MYLMELAKRAIHYLNLVLGLHHIMDEPCYVLTFNAAPDNKTNMLE